MDAGEVGRWLLMVAGVLALVGIFLLLGGRFLPLGRLPGDIIITRGNLTFYFPLVTALLVSLVLTLWLNLVARR